MNEHQLPVLSLIPNQQDIKTVQNSDIFVYGGTEHDKWVENLTRRYLGNINCACFTPNTERVEDIIRLVK